MDESSEAGSRTRESPSREPIGSTPAGESAGMTAEHTIDKSPASRLEEQLSVPVPEPRPPRSVPRAVLWLVCAVLFAIAFVAMARACRAWRYYNPPSPAVLNVTPGSDR